MDDKEDRDVTLQEMGNTLWLNLTTALDEYNDFLYNNHEAFPDSQYKRITNTNNIVTTPKGKRLYV